MQKTAFVTRTLTQNEFISLENITYFRVTLGVNNNQRMFVNGVPVVGNSKEIIPPDGTFSCVNFDISFINSIIPVPNPVIEAYIEYKTLQKN